MPQLFNYIVVAPFYDSQDLLHFFLGGLGDSQGLSLRPDRLYLNIFSSSFSSRSVGRNDNRGCNGFVNRSTCRDDYGYGSDLGAATWMITGPKIAFEGAISGEKILPLRVILLVLAILLMS